MISAVNIITTCVDGKTLSVPKSLHLRDVKGSCVEERISEWWERLTVKRDERISSQDLYKGDHWKVVQTFSQSASLGGLDSLLWIASAGYGLIRPQTRVKPYAATFSPCHLDSVNSGFSEKSPGEVTRKWWKQISKQRRPEYGVPRSIEAVVNEMPNRPVLVVASKTYITAMYEDLLAARSALNDPEKLIIVSTSAEHLGELEENKLPCDARMQTVVNGSRISLNARVGRKVLIEAGRWPLNISLLKDRYSRLIAKQPDIHRYERCPMSDTEIIQYIKVAIKQTPDLTTTRTLREFRDKGNACEQKRFGKLFREVKGESSGT